jgi:hypothetical protein
MSIYTDHGYENRRDYLESLAEEMGIDFATVAMAANLLGPDEDFDALPIELEENFM